MIGGDAEERFGRLRGDGSVHTYHARLAAPGGTNRWRPPGPQRETTVPRPRLNEPASTSVWETPRILRRFTDVRSAAAVQAQG